MKIICVSEWCNRYHEIAKVSLPNLFEYCRIHGYDHHVIKLGDDEGFHYKKHEAFIGLFDKYDLIFYKDIDTVITNLSVPIETFIDDSHDLFICEDFMGINGGSLILKKVVGGVWVNNFILADREKFNNEQEVMDYYKDALVMMGYMKILKHPSINSYPYENYPEFKNVTHEQGQWQEGDFLIHCPALPYEKRAEILRNAKITR